MDPSTTPVETLYRGRFDTRHGAVPGAIELRDDTGDPAAGDSSVMAGVFSRFDSWYEIDSWLEGHFIERTVKGAFKKTIKENRSGIVVSFDHGYDLQLGDKPLGPIEVLEERDDGPYYEVPLLDTDYNRGFILPALAGRTIDGRDMGSTLGASFRFRVLRDEWVMEPAKADHNPDGLPERTIREVRLYEFGPVVYPANPDATAGLRGLTDHYFARSLSRSGRLDRAAAELSTLVPAGSATGTPPPDAPLIEHPTGTTTSRSLLSMKAAIHQAKEATR